MTCPGVTEESFKLAILNVNVVRTFDYNAESYYIKTNMETERFVWMASDNHVLFMPVRVDSSGNFYFWVSFNSSVATFSLQGCTDYPGGVSESNVDDYIPLLSLLLGGIAAIGFAVGTSLRW